MLKSNIFGCSNFLIFKHAPDAGKTFRPTHENITLVFYICKIKYKILTPWSAFNECHVGKKSNNSRKYFVKSDIIQIRSFII